MNTMKPDHTTLHFGTPKCRNFHQTGAPFDSKPHVPHSPMQGSLPWQWFPFKIRLRAPQVLRTLGTIIISFTSLLSILLARRLGFLVLLILSLPNLFVSYPLFYFAFIMDWNFQLREGICWCLGKSFQAKQYWEQTTNPALAKHVFFSYKISNNMRIDVLNDGEQELWHLNGVELGSELSAALNSAGFVGTIMNSNMVQISNTDNATSNMPSASQSQESSYKSYTYNGNGIRPDHDGV